MKAGLVAAAILAAVAFAIPCENQGGFLLGEPNVQEGGTEDKRSDLFNPVARQAQTTRSRTTRSVAPLRTTTAAVVTTAPVSTAATTTAAVVTTSPAPASSTICSAQAAASGSSDGGSSYINSILTHHNIHRANHSATDIEWDDDLADTARKIAQSCVYAHDTSVDGGGYGQNIGAGYLPYQAPNMLTNGMYNSEIGYYPSYGNEPDMSNFHAWGHFSQIVWKSTTSVGCYTAYCPCGLANTGGPNSGVRPYFTVCNYSPPGNWGGRYAANVGAPKGAATVEIPW